MSTDTKMGSNPAHPSSLEDTGKTAEVDAVDNANKLQGYGSTPGVVDEVTRVVDHKAERRLCRRFDFRLLPVLAIMCMIRSRREENETSTDLSRSL